MNDVIMELTSELENSTNEQHNFKGQLILNSCETNKFEAQNACTISILQNIQYVLTNKKCQSDHPQFQILFKDLENLQKCCGKLFCYLPK